MSLQKLLHERGVALLLALMMVTFILLIAVFVASLSSGQLRLAGSSGDSSRAFAAADAGIEYALRQVSLALPVGQDAATCKCGAAWCPASPPTFSSNAEYCVTADNPSSPRKITAVGRTTDTGIRRSLEIVLPGVLAAVGQLQTICFAGNGSAQSPNSMCITQSYFGGTGLIYTTVSDCIAVAGPTLISGTSQLARSDRTFNTVAGSYYLVQCFKS